MKDLREVILKHALLNAVEHDGKANIQAVLGKVIAEVPEIKDKISKIIKDIQSTVAEVNSTSLESQKEKIKQIGAKKIEKKVKERSELPELPNAKKGKVVMRLAPYPSGPLHIGNARMVILNDEYVKRYKGKLFLIIDDTIGSEEKFIIPEGYDMVIDGLKWLGVKYHKKFLKSNRLKVFYKYAEILLKKGLAYVCECDSETLRSNRANGTACKHREQTAHDNLRKWRKMLKGNYKEGQVVVRLKTSMQNENPAFRDRVLLRIAERKHPLTGTKYKVWPMLEFSWAIDDHIFGMTHILRGKDLVMEDLMEKYIWDSMSWKKPEFIHYGLLNIQEAKLSKTEARKSIEKKIYTGWDDPRTWSLQSLRRRGIEPQAVRNFVIAMGLSQSDVTVPAEILYSENRKLIDSKANRYFAVFNPVKIKISGNQKIKETKSVVHPDFPKRGSRKIPVDVKEIFVEREDFEKFRGNEVGLMNLFTIKLDSNSQFVSNEIRYEDQKIHWVSEPNMKLKIVMPDGSVKTGIGEVNMKKLKAGQAIQLVRVGFCRVDKINKGIVLYYAHK